MAQYEKVFTKPYEDGYEDLPSQNTPITAQTLNDKDTAIEHIENFLDGKEFPTAEDESAWDGAVSDIDYYEQNGFLSKNLYNQRNLLNISEWAYSNNVYSGSASNFASYYHRTSGKSLISDMKPNTVYTLSIKGYSNSATDGIGIGFYYTDGTREDTTVLTSTDAVHTVTSNPNKTIASIHGFYSGNATCYVEYIQIEEGKIATAYMPYAPSNNTLDSQKSDIASIGTDESGRTTASKAYSVGEHFYKDGKFCTAIASIASGATFTLNTNYVEDDISEYLNVTTGELTVNSDFTSSVTLSGGRAYRSGNLVRVQAQISVSNMTTFSGSSKTIINIPWRNVNFAVFGQINKSSDNYEMITETGLFMSNGGGGLRLRKSLPDGSYYININYLTTDPI